MKRPWTNEELLEHWTLSSKEFDLIGDSKTDHNLLGAACLLKYFQSEGRFPFQKQDVPLLSSCIWPSSWGWSRRRSFLTTGMDARSRRIAPPSARFSTFTRPRSFGEQAESSEIMRATDQDRTDDRGSKPCLHRR